MNSRTLLPLLVLGIHALWAQEPRNAPRVYGPATLQYSAAHAQLTLPVETSCIQGDSAKIYLSRTGYPDVDVDAVVVSTAENSKWNLRVKFYREGHITTGDARSELGDIYFEDEVKKEWNKENGLRLLGGFPDQPYTRMIENPVFSDEGPSFSYSFEAILDTVFMIERRTVIFAKDGVLLASLSCLHSQYADVKQAENSLLSALFFQPGFRYAEFNEDTDKVA